MQACGKDFIWGGWAIYLYAFFLECCSHFPFFFLINNTSFKLFKLIWCLRYNNAKIYSIYYLQVNTRRRHFRLIKSLSPSWDSPQDFLSAALTIKASDYVSWFHNPSLKRFVCFVYHKIKFMLITFSIIHIELKLNRTNKQKQKRRSIKWNKCTETKIYISLSSYYYNQ